MFHEEVSQPGAGARLASPNLPEMKEFRSLDDALGSHVLFHSIPVPSKNKDSMSETGLREWCFNQEAFSGTRVGLELDRITVAILALEARREFAEDGSDDANVVWLICGRLKTFEVYINFVCEEFGA